MKYVLPALVLASPAMAHSGAHLHPHDSGAWLIALLCLVLAGGAFWAAKMRK